MQWRCKKEEKSNTEREYLEKMYVTSISLTFDQFKLFFYVLWISKCTRVCISISEKNKTAIEMSVHKNIKVQN